MCIMKMEDFIEKFFRLAKIIIKKLKLKMMVPKCFLKKICFPNFLILSNIFTGIATKDSLYKGVYTFTNLEPSQSYEVMVRGRNVNGWGKSPLKPITFETGSIFQNVTDRNRIDGKKVLF